VLRIVKPKGNSQIGKFAGAQNLRRDLIRHLRVTWTAKLADLVGKRRPDATLKTRAPRAGRPPAMAKYVSRRIDLRGRHRGKIVKARILKNGVIKVGSREYTSPSLAARAACNTKQAVNGWMFWTYERAPGDWVRLAELRR
jgi:hypothetical protein